MSAAASARLDKGHCKRTRDIMPFIAAGLQRPTPTGLPLPSEIAANSKNCAEALASHYGRNMEIKGLIKDWGPKAAQAQQVSAQPVLGEGCVAILTAYWK